MPLFDPAPEDYAARAQCCPMDTYDTDTSGDLRPVCTCADFCDCMCRDCTCTDWLVDELY